MAHGTAALDAVRDGDSVVVMEDALPGPPEGTVRVPAVGVREALPLALAEARARHFADTALLDANYLRVPRRRAQSPGKAAGRRHAAMTVPVIRPAEAGDVERMAEIARSSPTAPQWTPEQFLDGLPNGLPGGPLLRVGLVAQVAGEVCGFAIASALISVFPVEAELESIAVDPAQQGRGIGLCLLNEVTAWAMSHGSSRMRLEVRASNERATRLYRRAGFRQTALRARYYTHPAEDAVVMERTLLPPGNDLHERTLA